MSGGRTLGDARRLLEPFLDGPARDGRVPDGRVRDAKPVGAFADGTSSGGALAGMALRVLAELAPTAVLDSLIDELIEDAVRNPADTLARARLSYRHPLGFQKITLLLAEPAYTLRVHVWPPALSGTSAPEHIHNHRFSLASRVLHGAMTMKLYVPDERGEALARYEEASGQAAKGWRLRSTGLAAVRGTADLRLAAGSDYWLAADVLHQVVPRPEAATMTLFLETATSREPDATTQVYAEPGAVVPEWIERQPVDVAGYLGALRGLRAFTSG